MQRISPLDACDSKRERSYQAIAPGTLDRILCYESAALNVVSGRETGYKRVRGWDVHPLKMLVLVLVVAKAVS